MAEKEYIEREAAYPIAKKIVDAITNGEYHAGVFAYDIMDWIDDIPAADVRPVVHGSWIVDDHGDYQLIECDQCHAQMWNHQSELPNYCYECGAYMSPERGTKE